MHIGTCWDSEMVGFSFSGSYVNCNFCRLLYEQNKSKQWLLLEKPRLQFCQQFRMKCVSTSAKGDHRCCGGLFLALTVPTPLHLWKCCAINTMIWQKLGRSIIDFKPRLTFHFGSLCNCTNTYAGIWEKTANSSNEWLAEQDIWIIFSGISLVLCFLKLSVELGKIVYQYG